MSMAPQTRSAPAPAQFLPHLQSLRRTLLERFNCLPFKNSGIELVPALGNAGGRPTRACQRPTPFTGGVEYRRKTEECRLQAEAARVNKADLAAAQVETRARRFDLSKNGGRADSTMALFLF